ncbi:MAG: Rieske 2Fe-2S domain-containing protein [Actinomycetes bacterium]
MPNAMARLFDSLADRIERLEALDPLAAKLSKSSASLYRNRTVKDLASGTPLGHPLHPLLVTVPIGFWGASSLLDLLRQPEAARTLTGAGVLAYFPTAASGLSDWTDTQGAEKRVGIVHASLNATAVTLFSASWLARRRGRHLLGATLSLVGLGAVGGGGWLGGHLSYALGVGVDTTAFQHSPTEWTDVASAGEVEHGTLTRGDAAGVPVVLTRTAGGDLKAYADRCVHRGGPLHEGELREGCIVCPWHGSQFSVADGTVVHGPATRPLPAYEVRVEEGRVQVRADEVRTLRTNPVGI